MPVSVIVPTYNEAENVRPFYEAMVAALPDFELIFVDDNSPDGTAGVVKALLAQDPRVRLVERPGKLGLGSAVLAGADVAQGNYIAMMDADLSHHPRDLPRLLAVAGENDIVIGSRYVAGGKILGWPLRRHIFSRGAILLARLLVGVKAKDPISGFALFSPQLLAGLRGRLSPRGYKLLLEVLAKSTGARVNEVPITFRERAQGRSKFNLKEMTNFLRLLLELRGARG